MSAEKCIRNAINDWWGTKDPRPTLEEAIVSFLAAAGYRIIGPEDGVVVREGEVPPWMEEVGLWDDEGPGWPVMVRPSSEPLLGFKRRGKMYRLRDDPFDETPRESSGSVAEGYPCPKDGTTLHLLEGGAWCPECHTVWREIAERPLTDEAPSP